MTKSKEQYVIRWRYPNKTWNEVPGFGTHSENMKLLDTFKGLDRTVGKKYKYRIVKQTIQEEVVYNEL